MLTRLRSFLFNLWLPLSAVVIGTVTAPSLFRRPWALRVAQFYARQAMGAYRLICGNRFEVAGLSTPPTDPVIVASKHQSMWETIALSAYLPRPVFVLKKELLSIPVFGWWCRAAGMIAIDRAAGAKAMRDMITRARQDLDDGYQLVIFPEGTRTPPGTATEYQPGVAGLYRALGVPCLPAAHASAVFWPTPGFNRYPGTTKLVFAGEIPPGLSRDVFMSRLRAAIDPIADQLAEEALAKLSSSGNMVSGSQQEI